MKQSTLCLLIKNNRGERELLLAMKKKGFGVGKWNGVGGKFNSRKDKNIIETAIRETEEEIGIKAKHLEKVAVLNFYFPYQPKKRRWDQEVHIFFVKDWGEEPVESEEMFPKWFKDNEIPFDEMWPDDKIWLPKVLEGKKLTGDFFFKKGEIIAKHNIKIVEEL